MGIGIGGWVYSKLVRSTGGNAKNALIGAAVAGGFACLIVATVLGIVTPN